LTLRDRVVLLTGATGGIGRAVAEALAGAGARLGLFARGGDALHALRKEIEARGGQALDVAGDVRESRDCERAVAAMVSRFGGLDALVNAAGIGVLRAVEEATDEEIRDLMEVNVLGAFRMTRAALPALRASRRGAVVNVGSFAGKVGVPYYSAYGASKFALSGMSEAMRRELKPRGVDVTLLLPAAVETAFLDGLGRARALGLGPAGTVLAPGVVARAVGSALRRPRPEIYLPARNRWLAVVNAMFPAISDVVVTRLFRYPPRTPSAR
jgi:short-subunit dehydrogenase